MSAVCVVCVARGLAPVLPGFGGAVVGMFSMLLALRPDGTIIVAAAFGVLGFFILPILPLALSCAAEVS